MTTMIRIPASWQRATASATSGARRVDHRDEAEQDEVALGVLAPLPAIAVAEPAARRRRAPAGPGRRRPSTIGLEPLAAPAASSGRSRRRRRRDAAAAWQHRLGRALGVRPSSSPSRSSTVDISFSTGSKWNSPRPSLAAPSVDVGAEVARRRAAAPPRSGRRSASPSLAEAGVVAGGHRRRRVDAAFAVRAAIVRRPHAGSGARGRARGRRLQIRVDPHPVLGQGAGLVGADDVGRAERLDRAQPLDHRALADQPAHADGERQGDHRQQALGDVADDQPDREDDRVADRAGPAPSVASGTKAMPHRRRRSRRSARRPGAPGARAGSPRRSTRSRERGDPAQLGAHPGGEDQRPRLAAGAAGAAEDEVAGLDQRAGRCRPARPSAATGADSPVRVDRSTSTAPSISRASAEMRSPSSISEHVAGDEPRGVDLRRPRRRAAPCACAGR